MESHREKTMTQVSVIVTNYNYARFLEECLASVLSQTLQDLEVIVVDDGSTDGSRQILEGLCDPRVQVIYQANAGQAAAFNAGFSRARGSFVAFLDADDYWYREKLARCIEGFDAGVSLVQHNLDLVDASGERLGRSHPQMKPGVRDVLLDYFAENHTGFFSATSGLVARKEHLEMLFPLDDTWRICADVALTRPLPLFGKIFTIKTNLGAYRVHGRNGWMHTTSQKMWIENQNRYNAYANLWLKKVGKNRQLNIKNSDLYKNRRFSRKLVKKLRSILSK